LSNREIRQTEKLLVPKPQLGNALAGKPQLPVTGTEAGASGADAFPSWGLGTRESRFIGARLAEKILLNLSFP